MSDRTFAWRRANDRILEWRRDPVKFVREVFHVEPDLWQLDILNLAGKPGRHEGLRGNYESAHGALLMR